MKVPGRRLLLQVLSWDFMEYRKWTKPMSQARKKWSKRLRGKMKRDFRQSLDISL